jgi:hypothetical protein
MQSDCLGGENDSDPAVRSLRKRITDTATVDDADRWVETLSVVREVGNRVESGSSRTASTGCVANLEKGIESVEQALLIGSVVPQTATCKPGAAFAPTCWVVEAPTLTAPALPDCGNLSSLAGETAEEVLRIAKTTADALGGFFAPAVRSYQVSASELRGRWWSYFRDTRTQYPWELLVNASCFKRRARKEPGVAFHEPPEQQVILVHPGLAFEYLHAAPDGEQFKPAASVEVIGFNRWHWKGESPAGAWGASLVANYADVAALRDWRLGLGVHVRHRYTFGATHQSGDTGYFASADLAQLFTEKRKKAVAFVDKLKSEAHR